MTNLLFIGLDSIDSNFGGCTTHFTVFLIKMLTKKGYQLVSPPFLTRLNPSIPLKTRGNASVSLIVKHADKKGETDPRRLGTEVEKLINTYTGVLKNTDRHDYGLVVMGDTEFNKLKSWLHRLYDKAVSDVVPKYIVLRKLRTLKEAYFTVGNGTVGAVASLGFLAKPTKRITFELIAYRLPQFWGLPRRVDHESIKKACEKRFPRIFNNYDFKKSKAVAVPRGPDPVLVGLRGIDISVLYDAAQELVFDEPVYTWMLYATNQHTDGVFKKVRIADARLHHIVKIKALVTSNPKPLKGGHVYALISDDSGSILAIAYRQGGLMTSLFSRLRPGDLIEAVGAVKPSSLSGWNKMIALYKLRVLEAPRRVSILNPSCPKCGKTLKSKGRRYLQCPKCGFIMARSEIRYRIALEERDVIKKTWVTPPPGNIAHLIKPNGIKPVKISGWNLDIDWKTGLSMLIERTVFNPFR